MTAMSKILACSALALAAAAISAPAQAKGCLKGAAVGGVAGHVAGHHGLLGAGAGCLVGRHHASKKEQERAQEQQAQDQNQNRASDSRVATTPTYGRSR